MKELSVNVKLSETMLFKDMLEIMKQFSADERVPEEVREEYTNTVDNLLTSCG